MGGGPSQSIAGGNMADKAMPGKDPVSKGAKGEGPMGGAKEAMNPLSGPMQLMQGKLPLPPGLNLILGAKGKEGPSLPGMGGKGGGDDKKQEGKK